MAIFETGLTFENGIGGFVDGLGDLAVSAGKAYINNKFPERTETNPAPQISSPDVAVAEKQQSPTAPAMDNQKMIMYAGLGLAALLTLYLVVK